MQDRKFLQLQDLGGVLTAELDAYRKQWQIHNPNIRITMSDMMRIAIREGLYVLREKTHRLEKNRKNRK